jgi:hypothetical protein
MRYAFCKYTPHLSVSLKLAASKLLVSIMQIVEDCRVGWICVLQVEYNAAQSCLDETYVLPTPLPLDGNRYTVGRIGVHLVVIAAPRPTARSVTNAAAVIGDMLRSFPNIKTGLTVGIGSGVPDEAHDIRLGDVIISKPFCETGGLVQFDFERSIRDRRIYITGQLDRPSRALRAGVKRAQLNLSNRRIEEIIGEITPSTSSVKDPGTGLDREALPPIFHDCQVAQKPSGTTRIHYGWIASTDVPVQNAKHLGILTEQHDILCFETSLAGLTDCLPILAIRGISHVFSQCQVLGQWQQQAAIAAAACAKVIVNGLLPDDVALDERINDLYQYEQLNLGGPSIRLVRLRRGDAEDIECELFEARLGKTGESMVPYEALSYHWGVNQLNEVIIANGKKMYITSNLYYALRNLRLPKTDRILWIDAICIDQSNVRERGHQVRQMGDIYKQAERVLFWLGRSTYQTNILLDSLHEVQAYNMPRSPSGLDPTGKEWAEQRLLMRDQLVQRQDSGRQVEGLRALLKRSWFHRVWIIQEAANARSALVCCGTRCVNSHIFTLAPLLLGVKPKASHQAVLDIMPGPLRKHSWWGNQQDLYTFLHKFRASKAHDPRDMVYALLGISSDAKDSVSITPDYTKSVSDVIHDTASFIFPGINTNLPREVYSDMPQFLHSLPVISGYALKEAVAYNKVDISAFLKLQAYRVEVTDEIAIAAVSRTKSTQGIKMLLDWYGSNVRMKEEVLVAAANNTRGGPKIMKFLLEQRGGDILLTENLLITAVRNAVCGHRLMRIFIQAKGKEVSISKSIITHMVGNHTRRNVLLNDLDNRTEEVTISPSEIRYLKKCKEQKIIQKTETVRVVVLPSMMSDDEG